MKHRAKALAVIGSFWAAIFIIGIATFSGDLGVAGVTGYAVSESNTVTAVGWQSIAIVFLFFTNLVTLFFYLREVLKQ